MSRANARASFISLIANIRSTSFARRTPDTMPRAECMATFDQAQRSMRLIFEPSRLKLYISPWASKMKAMTGLVRVSVSIAPPAPTVTTTIDPSTPTFQP
jgi:hypothetical protein